MIEVIFPVLSTLTVTPAFIKLFPVPVIISFPVPVPIIPIFVILLLFPETAVFEPIRVPSLNIVLLSPFIPIPFPFIPFLPSSASGPLFPPQCPPCPPVPAFPPIAIILP